MKGEVYIEYLQHRVRLRDLRGQVGGESQVKRSDMSTGSRWGRRCFICAYLLGGSNPLIPFSSRPELRRVDSSILGTGGFGVVG